MAEQRNYQGHVYTRNAPGEPWVLSGPAAAPAQGGVFTLPQSPGAARDDARSDAQLELERQRLIIAQQQAALAASKAGLDAQGEGTKQRTAAARGGLDTTESERTAAFLATRLAGGLQDLQRIGNAGAPSLKDAIVGGTMLGNYATDETRQRTINAQRDMLDAALTLGTGAAYTKEQIEAYRMSYFPQPGDAEQTVKDKTLRLQRLIEASRLKAGAAGTLIDEAMAKSGLVPPPATPAAQASPQGETVQYSPEVPGGITGSVSDTTPWPTPPQGTPSPAGSFGDSYLGQGMSGLNEGIGNTLGLPIDLTTAAMNLVPKGINAIANTQIPEIQNPFGGGDYITGLMRDMGAIRPETTDPSKHFLRRTMQSVGGAMVPFAGMEASGSNVARALLTGAGGGVGAATAQQVFPGNPYAEVGGELLGSLGVGAGTLAAARRGTQRGIEAAVPTGAQLRQQAADQYGLAESRGIVAGPNVTANLSGRLGQIADDEAIRWPTGEVDPNYPRAGANLGMADAYSGQTIDPRQIQVMRDNLTDAVRGSEGKERRIARMMLNAFDEETVPLAPELAQGRQIASRYLQADDVQQAINLAEPRAAQFSNSGPENALRTEFRRMDRDIINDNSQFHPDVEAAIREVSRGSPVVNALRNHGRRFAPTGSISTALSAGVPFGIGTAVGGPAVGAAFSATAMGSGSVAKYLAAQMIEDRARQAELIARNGGALQVAPLLDPETTNAVAAALAGQSAQYAPR